MAKKTTRPIEQNQVQKRYQKELSLYQKQIKKNRKSYGGGQVA